MSAGSLNSETSLATLVDDKLPTPLYHQVYLVLRNKILSGDFGFDETVPGEQETTEMFGVSRITAKRALNELADGGFVKRERGRGTRVIYRAPTPPVEASVEGLLENLLTMGLETQVDLLSFDYVKPNIDIRQILQCSDDAQVQKAVRVRRLEGEPFSFLTTYVPENVGRSYTRDDLATRPIAFTAGALRCGDRAGRTNDYSDFGGRRGFASAGA